MTKKFLIINADDFGRSSNVNRAAVYFFKKGLITDTNLMVSMPATEEAISIAKQNKDLPVGIHISLTSDIGVLNCKPLTKCKTLVNSYGYFQDPYPSEVFWGKIIPSWSLIEARKEILAQFGRFKEKMGKLPTHIASHHHIHAHPKLMPIFIELAEKYKIPMRIPILKTSMPSNEILKKLRSRVNMSNHFITNYKGTYKRATFKNFHSAFKKCGPGITELMVHPAFPGVGPDIVFNKWWEREFKMLNGKGFRNLLNKKYVKTINYKILST